MLPPLKPIAMKARLSWPTKPVCVRMYRLAALLDAGTGDADISWGCRAGRSRGYALVWISETGVRLYSSGQPGGALADRLPYQARLALGETLRLKVMLKMYVMRLGED